MSLHKAHRGPVRLVLGLVVGALGVAVSALAAWATEVASRGDLDRVMAGPVSATVLRVVDGDTLDVRVRIWIGQTVDTMVRVDGIDTPELRGRCDREVRLAEQARAHVQAMMPPGTDVELHKVTLGKFAGRVVARVYHPDGRDLARSLIDAGLARPYEGGRREPWCPTS